MIPVVFARGFRARPLRLSCTASVAAAALFVALEAHANQLPADAPPATAPLDANPAVRAEPAEPSVSGTPEEAGATTTELPGTDETTASGESSGGLFEQSLADSGADDAGGGVAAPSYDLGGYVRGDLFVGKVPGFSQGIVKAGYGELALKLRAKKEPYGDAFAEARFRYGLEGEERRLLVDLREAYVNAYAGPFDLRIGQQIIIWGRADAFNPTNNVTPFDLRVRSPVEDDRRVGNVGARLFLNLSPVRLEGVWMPIYVPSELPPVVVPEFVTFADPKFPPPELESSLKAGRIHLELPSFEASVSYLSGYAPLPGFSLVSFTAGTDAEIRVARTAYNHQVVGADFSTAIGDVLAIRAEAAYRHPAHYETRVYAPRPDLHYVLGLDRTFGDVSVIVQYAGRYTFDWERQQSSLDASQLTRLRPPLGAFIEEAVTEQLNGALAARNQMVFSQLERVQHLASARLEWLALHDTLSVSALAVLNFTTEEWLLYPKLGYQLTDGMSATLGGEIYGGPSGTLFGLISEQMSAAYTELRISF
jgi:hypothetical protein